MENRIPRSILRTPASPQLRAISVAFEAHGDSVPRDRGKVNVNQQLSMSADKATTRRFGPGDAVLFEDLTGQGHTSRSVGGDRLTVIVPLAD